MKLCLNIRYIPPLSKYEIKKNGQKMVNFGDSPLKCVKSYPSHISQLSWYTIESTLCCSQGAIMDLVQHS